MRRNEIFLLVLVFLVYLGLAAWLAPIDDELYYWCWSQELQWSYYDHPLMSALWIRASTEVFGHSLLAIRLPACLAFTGIFAVLISLTRPKSLVLAALVTVPFGIGAVILTPDTPLMFFWALYLRWLIGVHTRLQENGPGVSWLFWMLGGVLLGLGVLGKYTMGLAGVCAFGSLLLLGLKRWQDWLPGYILHGAVSVLVASPIWIHNIQHDFIPLKYQWGHAMADGEPGLKPLAEFVGVQILLVGTLPFVLLPWVFWNWRRLNQDPLLRACLALATWPLLFFLFKAVRGPLEGNWAMASYLGFWPLAAVWWRSCGHSVLWRWLTRLAFAIPAGAVLVLVIHLIHPISLLPIRDDRVYAMVERPGQLRQLKAALEAWPERGPVFVPTYQLTASLRFQGVDARQLDNISRASHFTQNPDDPAQYRVWFWFSDFPLPDKFAQSFPKPRRVRDIPLIVRGSEYLKYTLWEYRSPSP